MLEAISDALEKIEAQGSFCAKQTAAVDHLHMEVKEVGVLRFPLKPRQIKALIKQAKPAKFGWRDQTQLDPKVRDVWEIAKRGIKIDKRQWNKTLNPTLEQLKAELGLANQAKLKAELHNLLIYEPGQFFLPHQDSEKCDGMVATLVVVLPSTYRGGTLIIDHQGEKQRYPSTSTPADKLTFIGFYADCHHEVRPVTEGYRVALTYNLVLDGASHHIETPSAEPTDQALVQALANYFDESFDPRPKYRADRYEPKKLVYLLDHEYTPKGLSWKNLKNGDRIRCQVLTHAAAELGLEIHLALADIQETWDCVMEDDGWGYGGRRQRYWGYDDDDDEEDDEDEGGSVDDAQLTDLINDETVIRHWVDSTDKAVKLPDLSVYSWQVCWTTATEDFQPFKSEYEGWMGNYGNTMDRWYHRAAIILWGRKDHYAVLLEFNRDKVISEVLQLAQKKSTLPQAQQIVSDFIPGWSGLDSEASPAAFSRVLKLALKLDQADLAQALLIPLGVNALCPKTTSALMLLAQAYGAPWCIEIMQKWVAPPSHGYQQAARSIEKLSPIVAKLVTKDVSEHKALNSWMLTHQLAVLKGQHIGEKKYSQLAQLIEQAPERMKAVVDLLGASLLALEKTTHDELLDFLMANETLYPALQLAELWQNFSKDYQRDELSAWNHQKLYQYVVDKLTAEVDLGPRQANDWSIMDQNTCQCEDCQILNSFLQARDIKQKVWPIGKSRRQHMHHIIDAMRLPVTHQTERTGSPHKLVLTKTNELFTQDKTRQKNLKQALGQLAKLKLKT